MTEGKIGAKSSVIVSCYLAYTYPASTGYYSFYLDKIMLIGMITDVLSGVVLIARLCSIGLNLFCYISLVKYLQIYIS